MNKNVLKAYIIYNWGRGGIKPISFLQTFDEQKTSSIADDKIFNSSQFPLGGQGNFLTNFSGLLLFISKG